MTNKTIRRGPYALTIYLTDWGWEVMGKHDTLGDLGLLEQHEHDPPMPKERFEALWDLLDEKIFGRKADAIAACRAWLKGAA